jgi:hypothetical protein
MRYSLSPAEHIRQRLRVTEEQFSVMIGYSPRAYPIAVARGCLTPRMARDIAVRYKLRFAEMEQHQPQPVEA